MNLDIPNVQVQMTVCLPCRYERSWAFSRGNKKNSKRNFCKTSRRPRPRPDGRTRVCGLRHIGPHEYTTSKLIHAPSHHIFTNMVNFLMLFYRCGIGHSLIPHNMTNFKWPTSCVNFSLISTWIWANKHTKLIYSERRLWISNSISFSSSAWSLYIWSKLSLYSTIQS